MAAAQKVISKKEREELYTLIKNQLGGATRTAELDDSMLDSFLKIAIEDYSSYINNWLIEQQWTTLQNTSLTTEELTFTLTSKSLDFEKSFTHAYSKQVGLGAEATSEWELKKDFIEVSANTQVYTIPAGREINEILWFTPSPIGVGNADLAADYGGASIIGSGFGFSYMGRPAQSILPSYGVLLTAQDVSLKRRLLASELTYRITAGPNGTKHLYLYPIPGGPSEIRGPGGTHGPGSKVWYFYYDTNNRNRNKCLELNSDIIRLPSDVPLKTLTWDKLNDVSKSRIRRIFLAETKLALGNLRGKFSGVVKAGDSDLTMDYRYLFEQGEKEKDTIYTELKESLLKLTMRQLMEDKAAIAQSVNDTMKFVPFMQPIMFM